MSKKYRYPGGGYSFCEGDEAIFCGRKEAIDYIYNAILLNQCVILYGKSGTGKSSLLQAGVIPKILHMGGNHKNDNNFRIYSVRTGVWQNGEAPDLIQRIRTLKIYIGGVPAGNEFFLPFLPDDIRNTLWYKFKSLQYNAAINNTQDIYLMIIDQVEELFTYPVVQFAQMIQELADLRSQVLPDNARCAIESYEQKNNGMLSSQQKDLELINAVLYNPIPIKFIFSIRSDKLYLMGRLRKAIPSIFQTTFELYPFNRQQAVEAIIKPSIAEGDFVSKSFDLSKVSDYMIDFLEKQPDTELEYISADYRIEPFTLQIICRHIERNLVINNRAKNVSQKMISDLGNVLANYYTNTLKELSLTNAMQLKVQQLIEDKLIYEKDLRRIQVYSKIIIEEFGIDQKTLSRVVDSRLIKEASPGSLQYEISHDSLVIPILNAKRARTQVEDELNKKYAVSRNIPTARYDILEKEIKKNPYDYKAIKNKAEYYYLKLDYLKALDYYRMAVKKMSTDQFDDDLYMGLSNCYYNLRMYEKSNAELKKVIDKNPNNMFALYYTGFNHYMMGNFRMAVDYYRSALELNIYHKEVNYNLGLVYMELENYNEAVEQFRKVLDLYPDDYSVYDALIEAMILSGDQKPIEKYVKKLIEFRSDDADIYSRIADIYANNGNKVKALEYFNKALKKAPHNASYYANIGTIYSQMGKLDDSIRHFEIACKYDKKNSLYLTWLAFLYQLTGKMKKAIELFHKAVNYDPKYRYATAALAVCYRRTGDEKAYKKYIAKAQKLPPSDSDDEYSLASFEALCGNNKKAMDILEKALQLKLRDPGFAETDPDFEFIRELPRFKQIIAKAKAKVKAKARVKAA
jgi:tetratricopeptide (TPR) repeat protein